MDTVLQFMTELRRRRVIRLAALYIVGAWVVLQVADLAFPGLYLPESAIRFVWLAAFLGFPLALVFGWRYDITRHGIVRTPPADAADTFDLTLRGSDYALLLGLLIGAGAIVFKLVSDIGQLPYESPVPEATVRAPPNSIAVLPLENLTGDPEQAYLAAGMHDSLIAGLSRVSALLVTSRTSTKRFRDSTLSLPEIASELRVARVIEGAVTRMGGQIRVSLQLIEADTDRNVWTGTFDRNIQEVLALQDELTRTIAREVDVELTPAEEALLAVRRRVNPESYEAYLKGMYHLQMTDPESVARGLALLQSAVEIDPNEALAYAGLAMGYSLAAHGPRPPENAYARARAARRRALELDDRIAELHAANAMISLYQDWDWEGAERSFHRALELDSSLSDARAHYSWLLQLFDRDEEAIEQMLLVRERDPLAPLWPAWLGWQYWEAGRFQDALNEADKTLDIDPEHEWGWVLRGLALLETGDNEKALAALEQAAQISKDWKPVLAFAYARSGKTEQGADLVSEIEADVSYWDMLFLAWYFAITGDPDRAIRWIEKSYMEPHHPYMPWIRRQPALRSLYDDPRFLIILERMKLPPPQSRAAG